VVVVVVGIVTTVWVDDVAVDVIGIVVVVRVVVFVIVDVAVLV